MRLASRTYEAGDISAVQELYHSNGWTDGLPIVPPTRGAVEACLDWAMMPPDQLIGLEPVSQNAKQQVTGQVSRCSSAEHRVPASPECTDIEVAQARDLDVDCLAVWLKPTVLGVRHDGLGGAALGLATAL